MIGYLKGQIISKKPTEILLDVNGVGYIVYISIRTFDKLPDEGEQTSLYIYLSVRESAMDLYGFSTVAEKGMYELLISVSGIGPKLGLSILSGIELEDLSMAIAKGDVSRMIAVPGIGRKTAERLMVELKDKIDRLSIESGITSDTAYGLRNDAILALTNLGYNKKLAEGTIRKLLDGSPELSIENLIKEALSILNK